MHKYMVWLSVELQSSAQLGRVVGLVKLASTSVSAASISAHLASLHDVLYRNSQTGTPMGWVGYPHCNRFKKILKFRAQIVHVIDCR